MAEHPCSATVTARDPASPDVTRTAWRQHGRAQPATNSQSARTSGHTERRPLGSDLHAKTDQFTISKPIGFPPWRRVAPGSYC